MLDKQIWTFKYEPTATDVNKNGIADEGHIVRIQDGIALVAEKTYLA